MNKILWFIIGAILAFVLILLGWLCPIEGPFDYVYDNYANTPAIYRPTRGAIAPAPKKQVIYEDYNEDGEPEWYQIIPLFEVEK